MYNLAAQFYIAFCAINANENALECKKRIRNIFRVQCKQIKLKDCKIKRVNKTLECNIIFYNRCKKARQETNFKIKSIFLLGSFHSKIFNASFKKWHK